MLLTLADSALIVDPEDNDGLAPGSWARRRFACFDLVLGYSSARGLVLEGSGPREGVAARDAPLAAPGNVSFDALTQVLPFHFLAAFRASVQLKRGRKNLFKVSVAGELEGPLPLRLAGKATFEILWCDLSVSFDKTLVDGGVPNDLVASTFWPSWSPR